MPRSTLYFYADNEEIFRSTEINKQLEGGREKAKLFTGKWTHSVTISSTLGYFVQSDFVENTWDYDDLTESRQDSVRLEERDTLSDFSTRSLMVLVNKFHS